MTRRSGNEPAFCVVQFIELPFEGIDDYVCVPCSWMIRKATNDKVIVRYPKDEDPIITRERVKRKERYNNKWRFYMATVKYETNFYFDAEFSIAKRNDYGPLIKEESKVTGILRADGKRPDGMTLGPWKMGGPLVWGATCVDTLATSHVNATSLSAGAVAANAESLKRDTQPKFPVNKNNQNHLSKSNDNFLNPLPRLSIKRPAKSESKKEIDEKRLKLDVSLSSSALVNDVKVDPRSLKRKQSVINQDNQSMECSQAEESSVASNADESTKPRSKTPRTEQTEQALSSPIKDVDKRTEVINIDNEDNSQRVKKPDQNNSMRKANSSSNTTDVSMTETKPSTTAEQGTQPNQYNHQEHILDRSSLSNFQPQIENVRSLATYIVNEVSRDKLSTSHEGLDSLKMSAHLYSQMNGARRLIPIQQPVEKRLRPMKIKKKLTIAAQNKSNSINQTRQLSTRSVEQPPAVTNQSQNDAQGLRKHTGNSKDQTAPNSSIGMISQEIHKPRINFETSNDLAAQISKIVPQSVNNAGDTSQQVPSLSHKPPSYIRRSDGHQNSVSHDLIAQQRQMQPNHLDSQQQPRSPQLGSDISIKRIDRKQMPTLQDNLIFQALLTRKNFLSNNPQLQARMSPRSTRDNNVDLTTSPQNIIASETSDRQNTERSSRPIYQSCQIQHTTAHENGHQNLCTQEQLVDQATGTNSKTKQVHFMNDADRSPVTGSHLNVTDDACQTNECMVDETLSPYNAVVSDSDTEVIPDNEMSTDEAPVETTKNVDGTANDPGRGYADKPTAAQNSTSTNHHTHPRVVLEQQMLDNFATLFTKMGSTLRHTIDMYNTLRSSILDTAETYKELLGAVEQFNTAGNATSIASSSRNLRPEGPRSPEERHTKVTESAGNQDQHSNDVASNTPKKKHKLYRFALPPEYDAYDTRWTLKYQTNLPGLVELMPQSRVYVSHGDLEHCQQVSKDCKSLARQLLPEVFNRNALSVCSSMKEKAQDPNNVGSNIRPDLDVQACSVLLNFVLEHGLQHGWNTDLEPILNTLHSDMQEIRFRYGVMVEC